METIAAILLSCLALLVIPIGLIITIVLILLVGAALEMILKSITKTLAIREVRHAAESGIDIADPVNRILNPPDENKDDSS